MQMTVLIYQGEVLVVSGGVPGLKSAKTSPVDQCDSQQLPESRDKSSRYDFSTLITFVSQAVH